GATLSFLRRKGNRRTLLSTEDGSDLDDSLLDKFLSGVTEDRFAATFGIDHDELTRGGRAIVEGEGNLGQLVFGAGSDLGRLRQFQKRLQADGSSLFKREGKNPPLNQAIIELAEARRAVEAVSIRSTEWFEHRSALDEARRHKEEIDRDLSERQRFKSRL